jgi:hypothetical protein
VRIDRQDDGDTTPASADVPEPHAAAESGTDASSPRETSPAPSDAAGRTERSLENRASVDATYRAYAIDQAYERVTEIESRTVTPAMRRIETEDPGRHLAGLENKLKGRYRIEQKVNEGVEERGNSVEEALGSLKDVIRYTFCYAETRYTTGVYADCDRLENAGFERFDRRNSWGHDEYKGINTRWRVTGNGQLFEVQFHTEASLAAKEETHDAYKRLRTLPADDAEVSRLRAYQRDVTAKVPIPPGALEIPDYQ